MHHTLCTNLRAVAMIVAALLLFSCEKPLSNSEPNTSKEETLKDNEVNVTFNVSKFEQTSFGGSENAPRKAKSVAEVCTRISLTLFSGDVSYEFADQTKDDEDFGHFSLTVEKGTYTVALVAHNGLGSAKIGDDGKVTFKDNKVTDTFYYYGEVTISEDTEFDLTLKRAVAMFRLVVNDNVPSDVAQMKLYYTGGSSTFDITSGYGCVNSRQTELRDVSASAHSSSSVYEVYTFPHSDGKKLKIKVSALDSSGATVAEREFEDVPVAINEITQYSGYFFTESPGGGRIKGLKVEDEWTQTDYEY